MATFLVRRLVFLIVVVIGVSLLTFVISHLVPADPARLLLGRTATAEQVAALRQNLGLDQPLPVQYLIYLGPRRLTPGRALGAGQGSLARPTHARVLHRRRGTPALLARPGAAGDLLR